MNPLLDILGLVDPTQSLEFGKNSGNILGGEVPSEEFSLLLAQNMNIEPAMLLDGGIVTNMVDADIQSLVDIELLQDTPEKTVQLPFVVETDQNKINAESLLLTKEEAELLPAKNDTEKVVDPMAVKADPAILYGKVAVNPAETEMNGGKPVQIMAEAAVSKAIISDKAMVETDAEPKVIVTSKESHKVIFADNRLAVDYTENEQLTEIEKKSIDNKMEQLVHRVNVKNIELSSNQKTVNIPTVNPVVENKIRADANTFVNADNKTINGQVLTQNASPNQTTVYQSSIEDALLMEADQADSNRIIESKVGTTEKLFTEILEQATGDTKVGSEKAGIISMIQTERAINYKEDVSVRQVRFVLPENLKENMTNGRQTISIKLIPEQLGNVRLTLTSFNNNISGRMIVENPHALNSVETNLHHLLDDLAGRGLKLESFDVSLAGNQSGQNFEHSKNSQSMRQGGRRFANNNKYESNQVEEITGISSRNYIGADRVNLVA